MRPFLTGKDLFLTDMLADRLDRLWLKIFLRDWIKTGKALHKLSPNKELAIELNNLYKIYLKI